MLARYNSENFRTKIQQKQNESNAKGENVQQSYTRKRWKFSKKRVILNVEHNTKGVLLAKRG